MNDVFILSIGLKPILVANQLKPLVEKGRQYILDNAVPFGNMQGYPSYPSVAANLAKGDTYSRLVSFEGAYSETISFTKAKIL